MSEESPKPSTSASDESKSVVVLKRYVDHKIRLNPENRAIKLIKKPQIVLEEEDFTNELEKIIVRDYFPEIPRLKVIYLNNYINYTGWPKLN